MCSVMMLLIGCLAAAPKAYISKEIPRGGASLMIKAKAVAPAVLAVEQPQEIFVWSTWTNTPFNVFVSANGTQWDYVQTLQPGDYVDYTVPSNQPQTFFSATITNLTSKLSWQPSSSTDVVSYVVYSGFAKGHETNVVFSSNVLSTVVGGMASSNTYWFTVTARSASGGQSIASPETNVVVSPPPLNTTPLPPYIDTYIPTNIVIACGLTNVPFTVYHSPSMHGPLSAWKLLATGTNQITTAYDGVTQRGFFYAVGANTNYVPLKLWFTGYIQRTYNY